MKKIMIALLLVLCIAMAQAGSAESLTADAQKLDAFSNMLAWA